MTKQYTPRLITKRRSDGVMHTLYSGNSSITHGRNFLLNCANAKPFRKYALENERRLNEDSSLIAVEIILYRKERGKLT